MLTTLEQLRKEIIHGLRGMNEQIEQLENQTSGAQDICKLIVWTLVKNIQDSNQIVPAIILICDFLEPSELRFKICTQLEAWKNQENKLLQQEEVNNWVEQQLQVNRNLQILQPNALIRLKADFQAVYGSKATRKNYGKAMENKSNTWSSIANLRRMLNEKFNLQELQGLCLDLNIEYENLSGDTRIAKTKSLIEYSLRYNRLSELVEHCRSLRPDVDWPDGELLIAEWRAQKNMAAQEGTSDILQENTLINYLNYLIQQNRFLQLQGIHSQGNLVQIELDQIYIELSIENQENRRDGSSYTSTSGSIDDKKDLPSKNTSINDVLANHDRLVIKGGPGSGKTTLLRYLTLNFARYQLDKKGLFIDKLGLDEFRVPILLSLIRMSAFLKSRPYDGIDGSRVILEFLKQGMQNEQIALPSNFFEKYLRDGNAVVLFDGLDEIQDTVLRSRVAVLIDNFTRKYPKCRFIVTSRPVAYEGAARLNEKYRDVTIHDFDINDIKEFLRNWYRLVLESELGSTEEATNIASAYANQLFESIKKNEKLFKLAKKPLMLTVLALVYKEDEQLPDRRAKLYKAAVDVLLKEWDKAKGIKEFVILAGETYDQEHLLYKLQHIALVKHEKKKDVLYKDEIEALLTELFQSDTVNKLEVSKAVRKFLKIIVERTGLLVKKGNEEIYDFPHLTFQEYLAAGAITAKVDPVRYIKPLLGESSWREVIVLTAGQLSPPQATNFIKEISEHKQEKEKGHNLALASECVRDVGRSQVEYSFVLELEKRLRNVLEASGNKFWGINLLLKTKFWDAEILRDRQIKAAFALGLMTEKNYWFMPFGEPDWIEVPAGKFIIGDLKNQHELFLNAFWIATAPITNAQYDIFISESNLVGSQMWQNERSLIGKERLPVTGISWYDAMAYCKWLSKVTNKNIQLPSEAEWEKAAKGNESARLHPWGNSFDPYLSNSLELGLKSPTPVGIFPDGASPYNVLDMAGNVWEWTRTLHYHFSNGQIEDEYLHPYHKEDGREDLDKDDSWSRIIKGGAYNSSREAIQCASRRSNFPESSSDDIGFRVVWSEK